VTVNRVNRPPLEKIPKPDVINSGSILLAASAPLPQWQSQWLNFLAIAIPLLLAAIGALVWLVKFRKKRKRKYRQRHHEERKLNPTLAESGGLPPVREEKKSAANPPPP
jgi:hypothetical protein